MTKIDQLRVHESLTKLAVQSLSYQQMKEVPTKGLEPMNQPCLGAVVWEFSMEWRRAPWIAMDMEGTKHQRRTWKGLLSVEQAEHLLGEEQTEPLGLKLLEPQAT